MAHPANGHHAERGLRGAGGPDAFQAVIASGPWLGRCPNFMADGVKRLFQERPALAITLFLVDGANEGPSVEEGVPDFADLVKMRCSENLILGVRSVPGGGHVPASSLEDGLHFLYRIPGR